MKKFIYFLFAAAIMASCKTAPKVPHYNITGKIAGADSVTFVLQKRVDGKTVRVDSAMVLKGQFIIKGGVVDFPERVNLMAKGRRAAFSFYLENTDIVVTGHIDSLANATISGSKTNDEAKAYNESLKPFNDKNNALYAEYTAAKQAGDKAKMTEIEKKSDALYAEQVAFSKEYVKTHPASFLTPTLLNSLSLELDATEIETFINGLDTTVAKVAIIKDLKARVAVMKTVAIGQKAPDFTLNDVNDKPVPLSSKIGKSKLLLIDFWASWCGPCRNENPNVVKVFKEFNKKGLDIFSVSLDREGEKEKWVQAIKDDKLTWTHVSDLKYWSCAAAKLYAVNSIPANFLLDNKGTIIGKNLRGDELYNKVKELLTAKK
jgi:peroxiredoxin